MSARCPECLADEIEETARESLESGLRRTFECQDCGHVWSVVF